MAVITDPEGKRLIQPACPHTEVERSPLFRGYACINCGQPRGRDFALAHLPKRSKP